MYTHTHTHTRAARTHTRTHTHTHKQTYKEQQEKKPGSVFLHDPYLEAVKANKSMQLCVLASGAHTQKTDIVCDQRDDICNTVLYLRLRHQRSTKRPHA